MFHICVVKMVFINLTFRNRSIILEMKMMEEPIIWKMTYIHKSIKIAYYYQDVKAVLNDIKKEYVVVSIHKKTQKDCSCLLKIL